MLSGHINDTMGQNSLTIRVFSQFYVYEIRIDVPTDKNKNGNKSRFNFYGRGDKIPSAWFMPAGHS